jgi:hypothetical protein
MGIGKSTVADELCRRLNAGSKIVLDEVWLSNDFLSVGGPERFNYLLARDEDSIVIEVACGEPLTLSTLGATRGATEWQQMLHSAGRSTLFFKLWADWGTIEQHMLASRTEQLLWARLWYSAYENELDVVSLPDELRSGEFVIDVSEKNASQIATEIMQIAGGGQPS